MEDAALERQRGSVVVLRVPSGNRISDEPWSSAAAISAIGSPTRLAAPRSTSTALKTRSPI
jgi:hypothetical protein